MGNLYVMSGIPVNSSYEHCLWFPSESAQTNYFNSKRVKTFAYYQYMREGQAVKVEATVDEAQSWTYCMINNNNGEGRRYYFITKVEYVNDATVLLHIELDVIQTFMFTWSMQQCFVERTHTKTDEIGEHTIPEGLETGPLIDKSVQYINLEDLCVLIMRADIMEDNFAKLYDGVFSGLKISAKDAKASDKIGDWLQMMSELGAIDGVVSMWMYPKDLVSIQGDWDLDEGLNAVNGSKTFTKTIDEKITDNIDGLVIHNNKLFCYPYTMLYVTNNMGGSAVYHREKFTGDGYTFKLQGGIAPDSGVELVPMNYKGQAHNYDETLALGAFPTCAWDSDTYKVWLAQNQNSQALAITQAKITAGVGAVTSVASGLTGNIAGAAGGVAMAYHGLTQVQGIMAQRADMEIQPPQARGNHSPNLNIANGRQGFDIHFRTITKEYAKIIDQYFTRYGYKVNTIMTPNLKARERFTYIKTIGCMVTGDFSDEHKRKIEAVFDKGVTFWVDPERVGNYTIGNNVLT